MSALSPVHPSTPTSSVTLNLAARSVKWSSRARPEIIPRIFGSASGDRLPCCHEHHDQLASVDIPSRGRNASPSSSALRSGPNQVQMNNPSLSVSAFRFCCMLSRISPSSWKVFLPVFFDCSSSFGYAGCVDTTKSISCGVSYIAADRIDQLTCPVDDCPPSFIHHPGKTASRYGPHYTSAPMPRVCLPVFTYDSGMSAG